MKKIIFIISLISLGVLFNSCERDVTVLNQDPKHPEVLPSQTLVQSAQQALLDQMLTPNVNRNITRFFTQQWSQTTYIDESNYDMVTRPIPRNHYNYMMASSSATVNSPGVLSALRDAKKFLNTESNTDANEKTNKEQVIELLSIYAWANLVDTYGDIPYSEAMNTNIVEPKYDDAKTIYIDLIKRLKKSISLINVSKVGYQGDIIYQGDMAKWKKMGASLLLRMGVTIDDVDAVVGKDAIQNAITAGVFTSHTDNFGLQIFPVGQFANPAYIDAIKSGRNDFVPSDVLVDYMNANSDPRRARWFTQVSGVFKGGTYGSNNNYATNSHMTSLKGNDIGTGFLVFGETTQGYILDYTEVMFLKAEAAARGYASIVGDTDSNLYVKAIEASMDEYGVSSADAASYIAAVPYDASNWRKSIGEQAWVAMF